CRPSRPSARALRPPRDPAPSLRAGRRVVPVALRAGGAGGLRMSDEINQEPACCSSGSHLGLKDDDGPDEPRAEDGARGASVSSVVTARARRSPALPPFPLVAASAASRHWPGWSIP